MSHVANTQKFHKIILGNFEDSEHKTYKSHSNIHKYYENYFGVLEKVVNIKLTQGAQSPLHTPIT